MCKRASAAAGALAPRLGLAVSVGAPSFGAGGERCISQLLIDEQGRLVADVAKRGLTEPEATFFARGAARPVGLLQGLRCSAAICREVEDLDALSAALPPGAVDLVYVPGALRQDPARPRSDPPEFVHDIQRLAAATRAQVVQTNGSHALNRPEESVDGGGSVVADAGGGLLLRLPMQASGGAVFERGARRFDWHAL